MFRHVMSNRYVGTVGVNFLSEPHLVEDTIANNLSRTERYRLLPVFDWLQPSANPIATNDNLQDRKTYIPNATKVHLLNQQANYMQKIPRLPKLYSQGPGKGRIGMWKDSDIFQIIMKKPFEE